MQGATYPASTPAQRKKPPAALVSFLLAASNRFPKLSSRCCCIPNHAFHRKSIHYRMLFSPEQPPGRRIPGGGRIKKRNHPGSPSIDRQKARKIASFGASKLDPPLPQQPFDLFPNSRQKRAQRRLFLLSQHKQFKKGGPVAPLRQLPKCFACQSLSALSIQDNLTGQIDSIPSL